VSLLQLSNGFGDIDEVVGDTFGVLGKGDILGAGLRFADAAPKVTASYLL